MFDSGISVKDLVEELKNTEIDIALAIPNKTYVEWLNSLQQLVYTEIIKEQKSAHISNMPSNDDEITFPDTEIQPIGIEDFVPDYSLKSPVDISKISISDNENAPRFEDIHAVYADGVQLIKSTVTSGVIFPNTFYKENNNIGFNVANGPLEVTVVYFVKPALVTVTETDEINDANVMLPIEFIDLAKAKLRGEAYKLANENDPAAKWLNDYNILLETFKAWISAKSSNFGM